MKKILLGLMLVLMSAAVAAQDRGFYIGAHVGQAKAKEFCDGIGGTGIQCEDKDNIWKILGGYQFSRNFAAEIAYSAPAEVTASLGAARIGVETTIWELVGVGMLPVVDRFSVYGKLGLYRAETEDSNNFGAPTSSETNNDLTFGFGARYDITPRFAVRGEWQRYNDVGGGDIGESHVDVISIGGLFRF